MAIPPREIELHADALRAAGLQPISLDDLRATIAAMVLHAGTHLPEDALRALRFGYEREESERGRTIYRQLLQNVAGASAAGRPTCQDTGQAVVFVDLGEQVHLLGGSLDEAVNAGVAEGYRSFRKSIVTDALYDRSNTRTNTPAVLHVRLVPGRTVRLAVAEKGYGSENKSRLVMHPEPNAGVDAVVRVVLDHLDQAGAGWCPPGILSVAIGGSFEAAPLMAKRALLQPFDMDVLLARAELRPGSLSQHERLRVRLFHEVNALGIGPQGLGGLTTVLDVKVTTGPTHIAGLPIAINMQCNKNHHLEVELDGSGPVTRFEAPDVASWTAGVELESPAGARRLRLPLSASDLASLEAGQRVLLSGRLLTGRDAAHKRMMELLDRGEPLPVDLRGQLIYYVGPVDPVAGEVVGPAGPTTASRMDPYVGRLMAETGLAGAIGKGEHGPDATKAIQQHGGVFMVATGGAAWLQARSVVAVETLAWPELGTEAIRALEVVDFPAVVAIDTHGGDIHRQGRAAFAKRL